MTSIVGDGFDHMLPQEKVLYLQQMLGNSSDLVQSDLYLGRYGQLHVYVLYFEGLTDAQAINNMAESMQLAMQQHVLPAVETFRPEKGTLLKLLTVPVAHAQQLTNVQLTFQALLAGDVILIVEGSPEWLGVDVSGGQKRAVSEPSTETVVRGPREGFTESNQTNISLVRKRIKDPNLWLETRQIGRVTQTDVSIMFIHGLAQESVLQELRARLDQIDLDAVLESGYIEEMIEDRRGSIIPTTISSERPDVIAAGLLEGRVAIFVDGTPFVILIPVFFIQFFQAAEDYYNRYTFSVVRILRALAFMISLLAPAFYVALTTFHQEAIPTPLLISLMAQREAVPFPAVVEALIMEVTFEILREAGVRMPRPIGQAVSIVGALVLGDAAVQAGLVSPAMVIVVSLTAISNFVLPVYNLALVVSLLRFLFMMLAATFGLFGISAGIVALVLHLCSLRSFGVPLMAPLAPLDIKGLRDSFFRFPIYMLKNRPPFLSPKNRRRVGDDGLQKR